MDINFNINTTSNKDSHYFYNDTQIGSMTKASKWSPANFLVLIDLDRHVIQIELSRPSSELNLRYLELRLYRVWYTDIPSAPSYSTGVNSSQPSNIMPSARRHLRDDALFRSLVIDTQAQALEPIATDIRASFTDVPPGIYHIIMYPQSYNANDECLCLIDYKQCSCLMSEIPDFQVPDVPNDAALWGQYQIIETIKVPVIVVNSNSINPNTVRNPDIPHHTPIGNHLNATTFRPFSPSITDSSLLLNVTHYKIICKFTINSNGINGWKPFDKFALKLLKTPVTLEIINNNNKNNSNRPHVLKNAIQGPINLPHQATLIRENILYKSYHHFFNTSTFLIDPNSQPTTDLERDTNINVADQTTIEKVKLGVDVIHVFDKVLPGNYLLQLSPIENPHFCLCHLAHSKKCTPCRTAKLSLDLPSKISKAEYQISQSKFHHLTNPLNFTVSVNNHNNNHYNVNTTLDKNFQIGDNNAILIPVLSGALSLLLLALCFACFWSANKTTGGLYRRKRFRCLGKFYKAFDGGRYFTARSGKNPTHLIATIDSKATMPSTMKFQLPPQKNYLKQNSDSKPVYARSLVEPLIPLQIFESARDEQQKVHITNPNESTVLIPTNPPKNNNNDIQPKHILLETAASKRQSNVLLVYYPDDLNHRNAVRKLARFLMANNQIIVSAFCLADEDYPNFSEKPHKKNSLNQTHGGSELWKIAEGKWEWIQSKILNCDNILLINSHKVYKHYKTRVLAHSSNTNINCEADSDNPTENVLEKELCLDMLNTLFDFYYAHWNRDDNNQHGHLLNINFSHIKAQLFSNNSHNRKDMLELKDHFNAQNITQKLLSCKFSHTSKDEVVPMLTSGFLYEIPINLEELFKVLLLKHSLLINKYEEYAAPDIDHQTSKSDPNLAIKNKLDKFANIIIHSDIL